MGLGLMDGWMKSVVVGSLGACEIRVSIGYVALTRGGIWHVAGAAGT